MSRYQILSLDGGGIRGVLTAVLLSRLTREEPGLPSPQRIGAVCASNRTHFTEFHIMTEENFLFNLGWAAGRTAWA